MLPVRQQSDNQAVAYESVNQAAGKALGGRLTPAGICTRCRKHSLPTWSEQRRSPAAHCCCTTSVRLAATRRPRESVTVKVMLRSPGAAVLMLQPARPAGGGRGWAAVRVGQPAWQQPPLQQPAGEGWKYHIRCDQM